MRWGFLDRLAALVALLALAAAPGWAQAVPPPTPWAHEASDIAPDPAVRFGALPNGMRYALLKNQLPPGAVSIRCLSISDRDEAESEKGLAHFIEHMAFNGSKNVAEGRWCGRALGLAFGADTNASRAGPRPTRLPTRRTSFWMKAFSCCASWPAADIQSRPLIASAAWCCQNGSAAITFSVVATSKSSIS
jgi:hypothetical protein